MDLIPWQKVSSTNQVWLRISAFLSLKAPNSQETYLSVINEWCHFLNCEPGSPAAAKKMLAVSEMHAVAYRNWLEKRPGEIPRWLKKKAPHTNLPEKSSTRRAKKVGLENTLSNATIAKKFAVLRRVYRMLQAANLGLKENPFNSDNLPPPPKHAGQKRPTEMLDFELVKRIIAAPDPRSPKGLQDKAILSAFFGGGLRRSEVLSLRLGDVRQSQRGTTYLHLRSTKAKRDAQQALPAWAAKTLADYISLRKMQGASAEDHLFISYRGRSGAKPTLEPLSASGIYKMFKLNCAKAGVNKFLSPHSARATAITKLLADGIPHRQVQEFSRHSSIQMVELYDKRRIGVDENPAKALDYD